MTFRVVGLQTIAIYAKDTDAMAAFYAQHLRLEKVYESQGRIAFKAGATRLLIHPSEVDDAADAPARHGRHELYLHVDDVDSAVAQLRDAGVPVVQEPTDEGWGERDAGVLDPEGYPVFLTQSLPNSWLNSKSTT